MPPRTITWCKRSQPETLLMLHITIYMNSDNIPHLETSITTIPFPTTPWAMPNSKYILYLPLDIKEPKQGFLCVHNNQWPFKIERTSVKRIIPLPNLYKKIDSLVNNNTLFQEWKQKKHGVNRTIFMCHLQPYMLPHHCA